MKTTACLITFLLSSSYLLTAAEETPAPSIWNGVFSDVQAERGKVLYQARCAICHGQDLTGDIESPSFTGRRFNSDWVGKTIAERFQRIRKTMPPEQPGSLDDQTAIDIVAFILKFNRYPSGRQELMIDTTALEKIAIEQSH